MQVKIGKSKIHGMGVFAARLIKAGETIPQPYKYWDGFHDFEGFNHSCNHNVSNGRNFYRTALRDIQEGEEVTYNYLISGDCNCESCKADTKKEDT